MEQEEKRFSSLDSQIPRLVHYQICGREFCGYGSDHGSVSDCIEDLFLSSPHFAGFSEYWIIQSKIPHTYNKNEIKIILMHGRIYRT